MPLTVSDTEPRIQYTASGGQTVFPYPFVLLSQNDVVVEINGVIKSLSTHYTVSGVGLAAGGDITLVTGATAGDTVTIYRDMPLDRLTDYPPSGDFDSQTVDNDFIRLVLMVQQLNRELLRSIKLGIAETANALPAIASRINKVIGFDATGAALKMFSAADLAGAFDPRQQTTQLFSGTGAQTAFTLTTAPGAGNDIDVFVSGVRQYPTGDYTISGTTLTFTTAPPVGTNNILVAYPQTVTISTTPADGSVTAAKLSATALYSSIVTKAANYTVLGTDHRKLIRATASLTLNLTAAATLANGHLFLVEAAAGAVVTIDPNGAELVNGLATAKVAGGGRTMIYCDGAAFYMHWLANASERVDVASAATVDLRRDVIGSEYARITGTAGIGTVTLLNGDAVQVLFADIVTLTHGAGLILLGKATFNTAADDLAVFNGESASVTRMTDYVRAASSLTSAASTGAMQVIGADCKNNAATPNTIYDLDADTIVLRDIGNATVARHNPGAAISCDVGAIGPAANGRDQAGAFAANSWIHFYWIWNGATLATLSSAVAPPTGPTLPTGYNHWAYAGAVRFDGSSFLVKTRIKGSKAYYETQQSGFPTTGTATVETTINVATAVPPNALEFSLLVNVRWEADVSADADILRLRFISGSNYWSHSFGPGVAAVPSQDSADMICVPNVLQQFFYLWTSATAAIRDFDGSVLGYKIPNGGE